MQDRNVFSREINFIPYSGKCVETKSVKTFFRYAVPVILFGNVKNTSHAVTRTGTHNFASEELSCILQYK